MPATVVGNVKAVRDKFFNNIERVPDVEMSHGSAQTITITAVGFIAMCGRLPGAIIARSLATSKYRRQLSINEIRTTSEAVWIKSIR